MKQLIGFFEKKYSYTNPMVALKAVNFFGDIDENIDPPKLLKPLPLKEITKRIQDATQHPDKIY
jgi:hypothetical protein